MASAPLDMGTTGLDMAIEVEDMAPNVEDMGSAVEDMDPADDRQPLGFEPTPGDHSGVFTSGGFERTFIMRIPPGYDPDGAHPLVFVLHGGNGSGAAIKDSLGFDERADAIGAIVVYPDGIEKNWSDARETTDAFEAGVDDVLFFEEVLDHFEAHLAVDASRIWFSGASNGGLMSQLVACELSERVAAVAPVIALLPSKQVQNCELTRPVSLLSILGTEDPFMTFDGGDSSHDENGLGDGGPVESAQDTESFWAQRNGCGDMPEVTELEPVRPNNETRATLRAYDSCDQGARVHFYIVQGMGHTWPPLPGAVPSLSGPRSPQLDATALIWAFFESAPPR